MDIFDKIAPEREKKKQDQEQKFGTLFVVKNGMYYCAKPIEIKHITVEDDPVVENKSTFSSRQNAKKFYKIATQMLESDINKYIFEAVHQGKKFDFACLSIEQQRQLLLVATQSVEVAEFLHQMGFDYDYVIKNSSFADLEEIPSYTEVLEFIRDKNLCDLYGVPLLVGVPTTTNFITLLRYGVRTDFVVNGKSLKDFILQGASTELVEVAFSYGLIGLTRDEVMELKNIKSTRLGYCPYLDMLKTEILESEKQSEEQPEKITTKKDLNAKAEIDALFESAQTSIK